MNKSKLIGKPAWIIEGFDGYHTGCFHTKQEALYRLNEMAAESFYNCGLSQVSRSNDMIRFENDNIMQVKKLENCLWIK
jgi:hypothetical protein